MIQLSERQWPVLEIFALLRPEEHMSIQEAQRLDQRPFRSMLVHQWIAYRRGKGFHLTKAGAEAWDRYRSRPIYRKNPTLPLTELFDPTAYGLGEYWRRKRQQHAKKAAAA